MKFHWMIALGVSTVWTLANPAAAQYGQPGHYANHAAPTLLPLPQVHPQWNASYPSTATGYAQPQAVQTTYRPTYGAVAQLQPPVPPATEAEAVQAPPSQQNGQAPLPPGHAKPHGAAHSPLLGPDPYAAAACSNWGDDCTSCLPTACGPCWFGGVYGLIMSRDDSNHYCFSYDTNDIGYQPLTSRSVEWGWEGGVEARFGRVIGCTCALEAVYWGLFEDNQQGQVWSSDVSGQLASSLSFNNLNIGGNNATDWTTGATTFRLKRNYEVHNVELNLIRFGLMNGCGGYATCFPYSSCGMSGGSGLCMSGTLGVRYFRLDEGFSFESENEDGIFGNDPSDEFLYNVDVENNLIGVQIGGRADYGWTDRFSLFADTKFGLFANYMSQQQLAMLGDGTRAQINNGPFNGNDWDIDSDKTDISFLGEMRLGGAYQITPHWRAVGAYRAVAISGLALSTEQIPINFGDFGGADRIDSNGSLILHGVQIGVEAVY